jgi:hypothetical protein
MSNVRIIWDLEDDQDGNHWHIVVEGHGVSKEEVEEVLTAHGRGEATSRSSGQPIAFGWTSVGQYIAVVYEHVQDDPCVVYPITAYPVSPPGKGRRRKR